MLRILLATLFAVVCASARAATPAKAPAEPYIVAPCAKSPEQLHLEITNIRASKILADIERVSHVSVAHADRIDGNRRFTFHFLCMPVRVALILLVNESGDKQTLVIQNDPKGGLRIAPLANSKQIDALRHQYAGELRAGKEDAAHATMLRVIELAKPGPDRAADDADNEYALLIGADIVAKRFDEAERLDREEMKITEEIDDADNAEYAIGLFRLAHIRRAREAPDQLAVLRQATAMLDKHPSPTTLPAAANAHARLAIEEVIDRHFDEAEADSTRAWTILHDTLREDYPETDWDGMEKFDARRMVAHEEETLSDTLVTWDRTDLAVTHYERRFPSAGGEKLLAADLDHISDMLATYDWNQTILLRVLALLNRRVDTLEIEPEHNASAAYVRAVFDETMIDAKLVTFRLAVETWEKIVAQRKSLGGGPRLAAAMNDLALLYRLDGRDTEADRVEREADAIPTTSTAVALTPDLKSELRRDLAAFLEVNYRAHIAALEKESPANDEVIQTAKARHELCVAELKRTYGLNKRPAG